MVPQIEIDFYLLAFHERQQDFLLHPAEIGFMEKIKIIPFHSLCRFEGCERGLTRYINISKLVAYCLIRVLEAEKI